MDDTESMVGGLLRWLWGKLGCIKGNRSHSCFKFIPALQIVNARISYPLIVFKNCQFMDPIRICVWRGNRAICADIM